MVRDKRILYEGRFLRLAELEVVSPSGIRSFWEIVERTNSKGIVVIVPVKKSRSEPEFIFVRHWRPAVGAWVMEFPAGLNDRNEPLELVAKRELLEETGYRAEKLFELGTFPASSGISSERLTCYLATGLIQTGEVHLEPFEELEVVEIPLNSIKKTLEEAMKRGDYVDLKVYALIELAKEFLGL